MGKEVNAVLAIIKFLPWTNEPNTKTGINTNTFKLTLKRLYYYKSSAID